MTAYPSIIIISLFLKDQRWIIFMGSTWPVEVGTTAVRNFSMEVRAVCQIMQYKTHAGCEGLEDVTICFLGHRTSSIVGAFNVIYCNIRTVAITDWFQIEGFMTLGNPIWWDILSLRLCQNYGDMTGVLSPPLCCSHYTYVATSTVLSHSLGADTKPNHFLLLVRTLICCSATFFACLQHN